MDRPLLAETWTQVNSFGQLSFTEGMQLSPEQTPPLGVWMQVEGALHPLVNVKPPQASPTCAGLQLTPMIGTD